jgi:hypothetical protein
VADTQRAIRDLAQGLYDLARAVEKLAQNQGNSQAMTLARRAKREGNQYR